jgi:spore coat polysaccharide biosynthesis protein SpsF
MVRVIGVLQARTGSTRLPGKVLAPIAGQPLLELLVRRLRSASLTDLWLATTREHEDDVLASTARRLGLRIFRGDQEDVLSRFASIVDESGAEQVVRLTADNPFTDGAIVDRLVEAAGGMADGADVLSDHALRRQLPLGYCPEIVRGEALLRLAATRLALHDRTHVTSALYRAGRGMPFQAPADWPRRPVWRWTIDTEQDLRMARAAFMAFGDDAAAIGYPEMVAILDRRSDITALNAAERQKAVAEG